MPTDEERLAAFQACISKINDQNTAIGLGFIADLLEGDVPSAAIDWAQLAINAAGNSSDCMKLLSPEQQQKVRTELVQRHNDFVNNGGALKGPAFGSNL